jgi:hypothetical protein
VVEEESGAPVAGAGVEYQLCRDKETPYYDKEFAYAIYWAAEYRKVLTGDDGKFEMAVVPGPGHLMVKAPTPDFVSRYVTNGELQHGKPGGWSYVLEGLAKIDPEPGTETIDLTIPLRRGLTVGGRVVGPEGAPVDRAVLLTPAYARLGLYQDVWARPVRDGRFKLRGCDPTKPRRVYLLDAEHQWGATVDLDAAKAQREPPTVHLLPCGSATVRFVDEKGHPLTDAKVPLGVDLIFVKVPPGLDPGDHLSWRMGSADRHRYGSPRSDADGRVTFPTLIPGAPYMLNLLPVTPEEIEEKEFYFSVRPGQTFDLGDIAVETPE